MNPTKPIRCAIYTRVSTEHGLDQEFNSLDAQRESAEAYIKSQAHEGWTCLKQVYNDGGYSGGSMVRPALQTLLEDVRAKKLDVIVVYKVDRLTRSLADFAKLVELFDANEVSFVSVTQSFNTTSSMGRLTLNVLLSFAQFEREVTGERIRDKVAASRKKGMWMGGVVPLGYRLENKKLIVVPDEAKKIQTIFAEYLAQKSLPNLAVKLQKIGLASRIRDFGGKGKIGGTPFRTGALSHLLNNRVYLGEVRHHKSHYKGEHDAIIEQELFNEVQVLLTARRNRTLKPVYPSSALLKGRLFDSNDNRMLPSHANKNGMRYRYYQSWVLNQGQKDQAGLVSRVPAPAIEDVICKALSERLEAESKIREPISMADLISQVTRISVQSDHLQITLKSNIEDAEPKNLIIPWTKPPAKRRRELVTAQEDHAHQRPMRSETRARLIKGIAQAQIWWQRLLKDKNESISAIAKENRLSEKSIRSTLTLAFLAPDIIAAAFAGTLPRSLTATQLLDLANDWNVQRLTLGIAA